MADDYLSRTFSENPDPQEKLVFREDITYPQDHLHPYLGRLLLFDPPFLKE